MIKNRRMGHIGLATNDVEADAKFYIEELGFMVAGKFGEGKDAVYFLKNDDVMYEMYQADPLLPPELAGKIDHYSFASDDIEADYKYCVEKGYKITTNGIEEIPRFWEKGVRYFKIASPTGEQLEFCQVL
ncbi:MAG: VOC family protein [Lachnospiraceae bacterium]|nr:VOC family protein [Lachnospiraceae bacterium]